MMGSGAGIGRLWVSVGTVKKCRLFVAIGSGFSRVSGRGDDGTLGRSTGTFRMYRPRHGSCGSNPGSSSRGSGSDDFWDCLSLFYYNLVQDLGFLRFGFLRFGFLRFRFLRRLSGTNNSLCDSSSSTRPHLKTMCLEESNKPSNSDGDTATT